MAAVSAAITTEFENVPAEALNQLAQSRPVAPSGVAVAIAQDRAAEKAHFVKCGVPCAPYAVIETAEQLAAIDPNLLPGILKTARMGYDGKGQVRVKTPAELAAAWADLMQVPCVLEKMLPLQWECSVIVARGADGVCVNLPVQRNLHRDGILAVTEVYEGNVPSALAERAVAAAKSIAQGVNYVGVLCVEFFVLDESHPAAAGSGWLGGQRNGARAPTTAVTTAWMPAMYRSSTCRCARWQACRLVQPRQHSPSIMLNLLGDVWPEGGVPDWASVLALPGTHLHLYGKLDAKKGRKMGHLNVTGATIEQVRATALEAARILGIAAF